MDFTTIPFVWWDLKKRTFWPGRFSMLIEYSINDISIRVLWKSNRKLKSIHVNVPYWWSWLTNWWDLQLNELNQNYNTKWLHLWCTRWCCCCCFFLLNFLASSSVITFLPLLFVNCLKRLLGNHSMSNLSASKPYQNSNIIGHTLICFCSIRIQCL